MMKRENNSTLAPLINDLAPADRTIDKIATLYNKLGAGQVTNYGARVAAIYKDKPWNDK